jgi:nitrogen fixation-related uncharacterized protein
MNKIKKIIDFYVTGFREMRLGKTLWLIILIKLFVIFVILRIFFFKPHLKQYGDEHDKEEYVSTELVKRSNR